MQLASVVTTGYIFWVSFIQATLFCSPLTECLIDSKLCPCSLHPCSSQSWCYPTSFNYGSMTEHDVQNWQHVVSPLNDCVIALPSIDSLIKTCVHHSYTQDSNIQKSNTKWWWCQEVGLSTQTVCSDTKGECTWGTETCLLSVNPEP